VGNRPLEAGGRRTEMRAASGSAAGGRADGLWWEMQARLRGEGRPGREGKCSALLCLPNRPAGCGETGGFWNGNGVFILALARGDGACLCCCSARVRRAGAVAWGGGGGGGGGGFVLWGGPPRGGGGGGVMEVRCHLCS